MEEVGDKKYFKNFVQEVQEFLVLNKPIEILELLEKASSFEKEVREDERRKVLEEIKKEKELHSAIIEMVDNGF